MFERILCEGQAVEIAREGREGRGVGTLFTLGDENAVLARSRPLILDPLLGHPESSRHVTNLKLRGTITELAQLDGGFVVSHDGIVLPRAATSTPWPHKWTRRWDSAAVTLLLPTGVL
jgi:DNA integrity scanning protein DisA with diadenylate cyclase activity